VTEDYYFWSHRLPVARAARAAGFEVHVTTHVTSHGDLISGEGFILHPTRFGRSNRNLLAQILALRELISLFRSIRPNVVYNIALKAIVFGSIASKIARVPRVINLVAGLGVVFTSEDKKYRVASLLARMLARLILSSRSSVVTVQNQDDLREIKNMAPKAQVKLIRGSGVDTRSFILNPEPQGEVCVSLVGRMLWHKGVGEFAEAAKIIRDFGFKMQLVGGLDLHNPSGIPEDELLKWHQEGHVSWLGHTEDIARIWANSHIAVLPSYREGLPKSLLEAASCGKPIVAADTPGCREVVRNGYNGFLVPKGDAGALAKAILRLGLNRSLREQMGIRSRQMVEQYFCETKIAAQTLELYHDALQSIR
jgi:glycosyltransferase involved in cell wall biosynthesis